MLMKRKWLLVALCSTLSSGCGKSETDTPWAEANAEALIERGDDAEIAWTVLPDGEVRGAIRSLDGALVTGPVEAELSVTPLREGAKAATIPLVFDSQRTQVYGRIPALDAPITEVGYRVKLGRATMKGALHLPPGGTPAMIETGREASEVPLKQRTGPNGGVIQVIGDDLVEVVASKEGGEVRVYMLDDDYRPIPLVEGPQVTLAVVGDRPEMVMLEPAPDRLYYTGRLVHVRRNPAKLTVFVERPEVVQAAVVGWTPGTTVYVGPNAPTVALFVGSGWPVFVVREQYQRPIIHVWKGKHGWKGKGKGRWKHGH